ncbi:MAG: GntR family transcriptional regulator [Candidatus Puniceispirillaceae bacterium]
MTKVKDEIIATLKRQIMMLELAPGTPLDEASLSKQFAISRTPLRDILRQLAGEGYVHIHENKGAIIAPMDAISMRNFFLTAPMIYAATARLAAQLATAGQINKLSDTQSKFKQAVDAQSVDQMVFYNDRFHYQIGEMADNCYLMPSLQRLLMEHARIGQTFWRSGSQGITDEIREACDHHDQFIDIFASHDEEAAVALTMAHWALSREKMDEFIRPAPLEIDIEMAG